MTTETLVGKATFNCHSRDLYWSRFIDGETCRWSGYDDGYWWTNVAKSEQFQIRTHKDRRYRLDPDTDEIFLQSNA